MAVLAECKISQDHNQVAIIMMDDRLQPKDKHDIISLVSTSGITLTRRIWDSIHNRALKQWK